MGELEMKKCDKCKATYNIRIFGECPSCAFASTYMLKCNELEQQLAKKTEQLKKAEKIMDLIDKAYDLKNGKGCLCNLYRAYLARYKGKEKLK
mgnify:CR=1 FL=1